MNRDEELLKAERIQSELEERAILREKRRNEVRDAKYENRRWRKAIFSIAPGIILTIGSTLLCGLNILPAVAVPSVVVGGTVVLGSIGEYIYYVKKTDEDLHERTDVSKEHREMVLNNDIEDFKCDAYIHEYEMYHTISDENKKKADAKNNNNEKLEKQEISLKENLKQINKKIILAKYYSKYASMTSSILSGLLKTCAWTAELFTFYGLIKLGIGGPINLFDILAPLGAGLAMYGSYNLEMAIERNKIYNKYKSSLYDKTELCDLESLRKKQEAYVKEIGNIKVIEKYNKSVTQKNEETKKEKMVCYHEAYTDQIEYDVKPNETVEKPKTLGLKK